MKKIVISTVVMLTIQSLGYAATSNWIGGEAGNDLTVAGNWSGGVPTDIAEFQTGATTPALIATPLTLNTFLFPAATPNESYNFNINGPSLTFNGTGVELNNNQQQTFTFQNGGVGYFYNGSSAYTGTGQTPPIYILNDGSLNFNNTSGTGSSIINVVQNGVFYFYDSSSADSSIITLAGSSELVFDGSGTSLGSADVTVIGPASLYYYSQVTESNATITVKSGGYMELDTNAPQLSLASLSVDGASEVRMFDTSLFAGYNNQNTTIAGTLFTDSVSTFHKVGTGTLTFSGIAIGGGGMSLDQGGLVLNGALNTVSLHTDAGTLLTGNGYVLNAASATIGGTISPGESIGTLSFFNTPYTQLSGSTYFAEVNGVGESDLINVVGTASTATIQSNTTLSIASSDGTYNFNFPYTLLHADHGIVGTFSNVVASPFLVPHVAYVDGPTNLVLNLTTDFASFADPDNRCLAAVLDTLSSDTPNTSEDLLLSALVGLSDAGALNAALHQLSGVPYTYVTQLSQYTDFRFSRRLFNAVREWIGVCDCCPSILQTWVRGEYDHADAWHRNNVSTLHDNSWDLSLGIQSVNQNLIVGLAGNYSTDNVRFTYNRKSNNLETVQGAIYALYQTSQFYIFSDLIGGDTWARRFRRNVHFGSLDGQVHSSFNIFHGKFYAEAGWVGCFSNFTVEPFIGGDAGYYDRQKIKEHGSEALERFIDRKSNGFGDVYVGSHLMVSFCQCSLSGDLYYQHRFGSFDNRLDASFRGFGEPCAVASREFGRNGVVGTLNFTACLTDCVEAYIELNGQGWEHFASYGASVGLALSF